MTVRWAVRVSAGIFDPHVACDDQRAAGDAVELERSAVRLKEARVMKRCAEACRWAASDAGVSNTAQYPRRNARHDRGARVLPADPPRPPTPSSCRRAAVPDAHTGPQKKYLKYFSTVGGSQAKAD